LATITAVPASAASAGAGIDLSGGVGSVANAGRIIGRQGGGGGDFCGNGGAGGAGIDLSDGGTIGNTLRIAGGNGGNGGGYAEGVSR